MFQALGDHTERQGLHACDGLVAILAVAHHARKTGYFCQPTPIIFALELDREGHAE